MTATPEFPLKVPVTLAALVLTLLLLGPTSLTVQGYGPGSKLSSDLTLVLKQYEREETARKSGETLSEMIVSEDPLAHVFPDTSVLHIDSDGRAQLYLDVERIDADLIEGLERIGVTVELVAESMGVVQARAAISNLDVVAALPAVRQIRLAEYGRINAGSVQTQGDSVIRADRVRNELNITGSGIRVGVIADGIDGLATSIFRGDIPPTGVTSLSFRADANLSAGSEGTAILEVIHDVAPDARLFFANFQTSIEFMAAQNWLADRTDLIIDSVSFFNNGPYNGTSPISTQTASLVARGVPYFTAVGNYADKHYQGFFVDNNGNGFHEFGQPTNAGETLNITLFPNSNLTVFLQWDDNFGSSANDYDLFLTDPNNPTVTINDIASRNVQNGRGDPVESLNINYTGSNPATFGIAMRKSGNAAVKNLELFFVGSRFQMDEFIVPDSSVPNNNDAGGGVLSIGAMDYRSSGTIEAFSSRGPTNDGRLKPDFVAPDGVSTGAPNFTTFFGTSAAAAHAGAAGALILSASPNISPAQVAGFLRFGAVGLGPLGPNNIFGYGRIDAFPPVQTLVNLPPPTFFSAIDSPQVRSVTEGSEAGPAPADEASVGHRVFLTSNFEVAGWALASRGVQKVEILVDGAVTARATYGLPRLDVCVVFANFPGCPNVGFVSQLTGVPAGSHTLALRITDNTGNVAIQPQPPLNIMVDPTSITAFIDSPPPDATVGSSFTVRGWAVSNLGIRTVELFLDGLLIRQATYGVPRPDVCTLFPSSLGCPNVGFSGDLTGVSIGTHQLIIRFSDNGGGASQIIRSVTVPASEIRLAIDEPANNATVSNNFRVSGWGIATQSVRRVEILVDNNFVTNATYGNSRPDVCQVFAGFPQCPNVGFIADLTGIAAGAHTVTARVIDTPGNSSSQTINVTVSGGGDGANVIAGFIDGPTGGSVASPFAVAGWAVATRVVLRVDVLLDGAVVQVATYGSSGRPDVCAVFPGFPGCPNVGFTASITAAAGAHTLQIRVVDSGNATAVFPDTPITITVAAAPPVVVPAGTYRGLTGQLRAVLVVVTQPNVIAARALNINVLCGSDEFGIVNLSEVAVVNGSFSATGPIVSTDPAAVGTFSVQGTFNPATSTFTGTLRITITESSSGSCDTGVVAWSAALAP